MGREGGSVLSPFSLICGSVALGSVGWQGSQLAGRSSLVLLLFETSSTGAGWAFWTWWSKSRAWEDLQETSKWAWKRCLRKSVQVGFLSGLMLSLCCCGWLKLTFFLYIFKWQLGPVSFELRALEKIKFFIQWKLATLCVCLLSVTFKPSILNPGLKYYWFHRDLASW